MEHNTDGGQAFPNQVHGSPMSGMSLRDYFAAKALAYICHFNILKECADAEACELEIVNAANLSYRLADEMLKARGQK
jgi:hypothetical protein